METLRNIISDAREHGVAVGHFNVSDVAQLNAVVSGMRSSDAPVVIGVSEGESGFWGVAQISALVRSLRKTHNIPLFLNADHTHSFEKIKEAVEAGFDAVLFDAGQDSLEDNIVKTKEVVAFVKEYNAQHGTDVLVEGELGYIGSSSKILESIPEGAAITPEDMTGAEEAKRFVSETGVDLLAPAVGNIHGMFKNMPNPNIDIARIKELAEAVPAHLVLHGGSGINNEQFLQAISAGVAMVHVSTELRVAWRKGLNLSLLSKSNEITPYKIYPEVISEVQKVVEQKLDLFWHRKL
jgi:fructose-bisphosphate aldolase class II